MSRIAILGAGHIGGTLARLFSAAGHDVVVSFSTDPAKLGRVAQETGARTGSPADAAAHGDIVVLSVPWSAVDEALAAAGDLSGKVVLDTTNQFGQVDGRFGVLDLGDESAAARNAAKVPGATWVKAFNTVTAGFLGESAGRAGADRVVMFYATDQESVQDEIESLLTEAGFDPVRTGTLARTDVGHQEPKGELYGEEFHLADARAAVRRLRGTVPAGTGRP